MTVGYSSIVRGVLLFWAAWFAVVTLTNAADALIAIGALPANWPFASGNYQMIATVTGRYSRPEWIVLPMFGGVIIWEALATAAFARAYAGWSRADGAARVTHARLAYAVALALWGTFLVIDEFFIAYDVESTHLGLFVAHIVCLAATELVSRPGGS